VLNGTFGETRATNAEAWECMPFVWEQSLGFTAPFVHLATWRFTSRFNFCVRGSIFQTFVNEICQINLCR